MPEKTENCPGINDFMRPKPEFYKCPNCGGRVEIWTDEQSSECENCGTVVSRQVQSCLDWCEHAAMCKKLIADKVGKTTP